MEEVPSDSTVYSLSLDRLSPDQKTRELAGEENLATNSSRGKQLADGRFEVSELLGRGGFAVVYRAFDRTLKRGAS